MKKKKESMARFMKRRNKETGKVSIPETKPSPPMSGGSHKMMARQTHIGVVKPKTAKKLEAVQKKRKKRMRGDMA
jgi:hypothetical protein